MDNQLKKNFTFKMLKKITVLGRGNFDGSVGVHHTNQFWPDIDGEFIDDVISCFKDGLADIDNIFLLQVG